MKVALFTNQFPGRVSTFLARDVKALLDGGMEVEIFALYPEEGVLWKYVPEFLRNDVRMRPVRSFRPEPADALRLVRSLGDAGFIRDALRITGASVRHGPTVTVKSLYSILAACRWAAQSGAEYDFVLSYWGNYCATSAYLFHRLTRSQAPFGFYLHAGIDLYRDQAFLREKLEYADVVFVVCDFNRDFVRRLYPREYSGIAEKIRLHHLGLNLKDLSYGPGGREEATLLGVGHHSWRKGFDYVLRSAAKIRESGRLLKVRLVGEGPDTPKLKRLAAELGLGESVAFEGWLPFDKVAETMRRATVLVHASPDIGDAVPTVIKEAMALGLPVVATQVAGIPELLDQGRCGLLVPPRDVNALAGAAGRLLSDETLRQELAERARAFAERTFDQEINGTELARILRVTRRHAR